MKRIYFLLISFLLTSVLFSQPENVIEFLRKEYDSVTNIEQLKPLPIYSFTTKNKVGIIDRFGNLIYQPYFESVHSYQANNYFFLKAKMPNGKTALLSQEGKVLFQPYYEDLFITNGNFLITQSENKYGLADFNGVGYLHTEFDSIKVVIDEDTLFIASIGEKNMVFNTNIEVEEYFDKDTIISFINKDSKFLFPFSWIIEPECDIVKHLGGGVFYYRKDSEIKLVNKKGLEIEEKKPIPINSKNVLGFDWERIIFQDSGRVGMIDYNRKIIVPNENTDMKILFEDELYSYQQNNLWGLVSKNGEKLCHNIYTNLTPVIYNTIKYVKATTVQGQTAVLNKNGEIIIQSYYDDIEEANLRGFFINVQNGGRGIINQKGDLCVKPQYDELRIYLQEDDTLFVARRNKRYTIFDTKGGVLYDGLNTIIDINSSLITFISNNNLRQMDIRSKKTESRYGKIESRYNLSEQRSVNLNIKYKEYGIGFDSLIVVNNEKGYLYADRKTFKPINNNKVYDYLTPMIKGYAFVVEGKELNIIDKDFNKVFNIINKNLVKSELVQIANILYNAMIENRSYQYIRKNNKYGILRLKSIKELIINQ